MRMDVDGFVGACDGSLCVRHVEGRGLEMWLLGWIGRTGRKAMGAEVGNVREREGAACAVACSVKYNVLRIRLRPYSKEIRYYRSSMLSFIEIGSLLSIMYLYNLDREGSLCFGIRPSPNFQSQSLDSLLCAFIR